MSETALLATLKSIILSLTDEGTVHDYLRWANDEAAFRALYQNTIGASEVIRGWTITMEAMPQVRHEVNNVNIRAYHHRIRLYFGLDDSAASEKTAKAFGIAAVDALDASATLHNAVTYYDAEPASFELFEPRIFWRALVNYGEILQITYEVVP